MTTIFNMQDMPNRRMNVHSLIAIDQCTDIGRAIQIIKENMARDLAQKIIDSDDFFWERSGAAFGNHATLEYGADVIVMTAGEVAAMRRESFSQGLKHAAGFCRIDL